MDFAKVVTESAVEASERDSDHVVVAAAAADAVGGAEGRAFIDKLYKRARSEFFSWQSRQKSPCYYFWHRGPFLSAARWGH